ncbi:MGMT family protein [Streptomyces galbus]|uniref:MGMT family protein n=1 Tax=Streptomyces galbus TaxID=33898 RepID=UPI00289862C9|nr:MGMT family protein [Streptomyces galbus]
MSPDEEGLPPSEDNVEGALADLTSPAPLDFGLRVLRHVGIAQDRYDQYVRLETESGGLYVAFSPQAVTGAVLETMVVSTQMFEELHWSRTGRTAIRATVPLPGLRTAVRTRRAGKLAIDLGGVSAVQRSVLEAVRSVPAGQLRPVSWVAREAGLRDTADVVEALRVNPVVLLVPCHRVTHDDGTPCDAAYLPGVGRALRAAEGIDMERFARFTEEGAVLLGSDTTRIFCHPTCAHARRITPQHQRPFHSAVEAHRAGYRACRVCRPVAA